MLRELDRPELRRILEHVDRLEHDHRTAVEWHREVEEIGERWLRQDHLARKEAIRLRELLLSLSDLYTAHIAVEERDVFPIAQEALSDAENTSIGRRMASPRGIPFMAESAPPAT